MKKMSRLAGVVCSYALLGFTLIGAMNVAIDIAKVFTDKND